MLMPFTHAFSAPPVASQDTVVILGVDRQLARYGADGAVLLPTRADLAEWMEAHDEPVFIGVLDTAAVYVLALEGTPPAAPSGWSWHEARALLQTASRCQAQTFACARQLAWWRTRHRFCGCCATPLIDAPMERARRCPACGASFFPSASPAVIVAVTRGDRLLLAHNRNFKPGMHSLLAGFLDPGETLEQAVIREVREEVGIEIGSVRYVTSQPWPFPNSLMAGFRATHVSGEICVDGVEIEVADWYARDALPEIPRRGTVARELIDAWMHEPAHAAAAVTAPLAP